jgi:hypothetical protein
MVFDSTGGIMIKLIVMCVAVVGMIALVIPLSAQANYLDVMTYMSGEFGGSEFSASIASLDSTATGTWTWWYYLELGIQT